METEAKKTITCDAPECKAVLDLRKPKKDEPPNEGISATLNSLALTGETKDYHFCDEKCLLAFLRYRHSTASIAKLELVIPHNKKQ